MMHSTLRALAITSFTAFFALAGCASSDDTTTEQDLADQNDDETPAGQAQDEARSGTWQVSWANTLCLRRTNSRTGRCFRQIHSCEAIYVYSIDNNTGMARVRHRGTDGFVNKRYLASGFGRSDGTTSFSCSIDRNGVISGGGTG